MFRDLTGVDPFIKEDIHYSSGLRVLKKSLFEVDDQYDLITLHHSYEHMPEPLVVMKQLHRLTKEGGTVLIRIPLADSYAWRTYGVDWLQLDAPRHIYLHTCKSIERIAKQSGFHIKDIVYDSDAEQFLGSEQYKRDIPRRAILRSESGGLYICGGRNYAVQGVG